MSPLLTLGGVSVRLAGKLVVREAGFAIRPGEVVGVVGPNGAGKTSLLKAAVGLLPLAAGEARLGPDPVAALSPPERARRVGYLPQARRVAWGIAAWRAASLGAPDLPETQAKAAALSALAEVGAADLAMRSVFDLSGGEQARVLLARLLATRAPLLVLDEPVASLDPAAQIAVLACLRRRADAGAGVLVTLHDLNLALGACDRLIVMHEGCVAADAPPAEALSAERVQAVFGLAATLIAGPYGPLLALEP